jgi:hypothetical protein
MDLHLHMHVVVVIGIALLHIALMDIGEEMMEETMATGRATIVSVVDAIAVMVPISIDLMSRIHLVDVAVDHVVHQIIIVIDDARTVDQEVEHDQLTRWVENVQGVAIPRIHDHVRIVGQGVHGVRDETLKK